MTSPRGAVVAALALISGWYAATGQAIPGAVCAGWMTYRWVRA